MGRLGVAISTTGDSHRMPFLETCVVGWDQALPVGSPVFVTVDGTEEQAEAVTAMVNRLVQVGGLLDPDVVQVYRIGQPVDGWSDRHPLGMRDSRIGVAANKNTGIELLNAAGCEHLFLSDDDTWPLSDAALAEHVLLDLPHSMLCWGRHRKPVRRERYASWSWPRGVMLYAHRSVIETVGGLDERFGPGGHEHVEWSNRICNAGLTPEPFVTPVTYLDNMAMGARNYWHAEDMIRPGEPLGNHRLRRRRLTSVRRTDGDWDHIEDLMSEWAGRGDFVPYSARENLRQSATLSLNV